MGILVRLEILEVMDSMEVQDLLVYLVRMVRQDCQDQEDLMVYLVTRVFRVPMVSQEALAAEEIPDRRDYVVRQGVGVKEVMLETQVSLEMQAEQAYRAYKDPMDNRGN